VFAVLRLNDVSGRPLATFRVERAALDYAEAVEAQEGARVAVFRRDEDPELETPTPWEEVDRTP